MRLKGGKVRRGIACYAPTQDGIVGGGWVLPLHLILLFVILVLAACAPAATPASVHFTPGPAVVVSDNTFAAEDYALHYPAGWRIVTGQADAPQTTTFVSPDNCAIILVSGDSIEPITSRDCADVEFESVRQAVTLETLTLTVAGSAPSDQWAAFLPQFERLIASVQARE
jgi:hypothetical protein